MIRQEEVYKIGSFNKPHGIHGELSFAFTDDIFDCADYGYLICLLDGIYVPFYMEEYRFSGKSIALVKLEGVDTAEQARKFTNAEVYFPVEYAELFDEACQAAFEVTDHDWQRPGYITSLKGFTMHDVNAGELGEIVDVDDSTVNVLFVVQYGKEKLLVPAQREFVVEADRLERTITVNLPEGLLSINTLEADD